MWLPILLLVFNVYAAVSLNFFGRQKVVHYNGQSAGVPLILTPFIKSGNIRAARSLSRVRLGDPLGVESYSGFLTVNETYGSNLFFWYFPSARNNIEDPVVLWLQGGPGSSSLIGLFLENGPLEVPNSQTLKRRKYTWQENHSMIFIDSPVGTGFSFTGNYNGYVTNQEQVGEHLYEALLQFFALFPEIRKNPFFVTGESYGGKYVPALSYTIHNKNPYAKLKINLQGFAIGNGLTDPVHQFEYSKYLYQIGLIDKVSKSAMERIENDVLKNIERKDWSSAQQKWTETLNYFMRVSKLSNVYNYLFSVDYTDFDTYSNFLNKPEIRSAIHVGNTPYYASNSIVYAYLREDIPKSVTSWVSELLNHYRGLFYVGQMDIICHYSGVVNFLQHLNFSAAQEYKTAKRKTWIHQEDIAGYVKTAGNMTEVLVRNSGHLVPQDQPEWALRLITEFTSNNL